MIAIIIASSPGHVNEIKQRNNESISQYTMYKITKTTKQRNMYK